MEVSTLATEGRAHAARERGHPGAPGGLPGEVARAPRWSARRTLSLLTACHTVNDFYGLAMPPLLPALIAAFSLSYTQAGVVPFVATLVSAVLQPTLGYVADRRRWRRRLMILGFLGFALAMVWIGATSSYATLLIAAGLFGLSASTYHPQSATMLAHFFQERRGWAQGIHGIGNGLGFLLAPLVIGYLAQQLGWQRAATLLAIPGLVAVAMVAIGLQEPAVQGGRGLFAGITRPLLLLMVVNGLALGVTSGYLTWLPSFYHSLGQNLFVAGLLTAVMSTAALIAQPIGGTFSDRLGRRNIVVASLIGVAGFLMLFLFAAYVLHSVPAMVLCSLLIGFSSSLMPPVMMVYASEIAAGERTGTAVGVVWGLGTAIGSFAPLLAGRLIDLAGFATADAVLAAGALIAAILALGLPTRDGRR
ncbi:MAG: MFS transporter [Chloroflexi bacterium]|nr:MFS transporter [Chloroflexota bacterium]